MVTYKAKPFKTGNSHVFVIPSDFIKHGIIKIANTYEIEIKEVEDGLLPE